MKPEALTITPEPRLIERCVSSPNWSPKKRRNSGSLSSGLRCACTSFDVKMLTTAGVARPTASWKDSGRADGGAAGDCLTGTLTVATGGTTVMRDGTQSGRSVETTNSTARHTVAACAKISQRRCSIGTGETSTIP